MQTATVMATGLGMRQGPGCFQVIPSPTGAGGRAAVLPRGCRVSPQPPPSQAVRLESARPQRVRYLLVVRPEEADAEGQTVLLGVDFPHEG